MPEARSRGTYPFFIEKLRRSGRTPHFQNYTEQTGDARLRQCFPGGNLVRPLSCKKRAAQKHAGKRDFFLRIRPTRWKKANISALCPTHRQEYWHTAPNKGIFLQGPSFSALPRSGKTRRKRRMPQTGSAGSLCAARHAFPLWKPCNKSICVPHGPTA